MAINNSFGDYSPPEVTKENGSIINLTVGLFFDGTLNNRRNSYIRKEKEKKGKGLSYDKEAVKQDPWGFDKGSYDNDYSNVARMIDFYQEKKKIYIEGIGTIDGDTDTTRGYTTGTGDTGIRGKVRIGCEKLTNEISKDSTVNLIIDLFGFSRGAAAARTFIHEITRVKYSARVVLGDGVTYYDLDNKKVSQEKLPARGHLGYLFEKKKIKVNSLKVRFVGLYDTVSSYGLNFEDDTTDEDDIAEINLAAINRSAVKNVVQIAAGHEWRKNFNLTNIKGAGEKGLELTLPGCHCDIGGAYESMNYEQSHNVFFNYKDASDSKGRFYQFQSVEYKSVIEQKKQSLIESGWYLSEQLKTTYQAHNAITYLGTRYIDKRYSYISLNFMCKLASDKESKFDFVGLNKKFGIPKKAGEKQHLLDYVKEKLEEYIEAVKKKKANERHLVDYEDYLDFNNEKVLINKYIHWSATDKIGHSPRKDNKRDKKNA